MIGVHLIFGAYGFWLPNDPRGSWSDFVGSWDLFRYGAATTVNDTRSHAQLEHDQRARLAAKKTLKYPAVEFTGLQARAMARGFARYVQTSGLKIWACAILPDHVHLVIAEFRLEPKQVVIQLKGEATEQLIAEDIHPFEQWRNKQGRRPKCFARGEWKVYLDTPAELCHAIQYVEHNPLKEGKKAQSWKFVTPFEG